MRKQHRWWWAVGVVLLSGCACDGYKQALRSVRDVGPRIEGDITPKDPGGEARKQAFHDLLEQLKAMDLGG